MAVPVAQMADLTPTRESVIASAAAAEISSDMTP